MNKRSAFFGVALTAVLAVATPATAGQWVVVDVEIIRRTDVVPCIAIKGEVVETGTTAFLEKLQEAMHVTAIFRESGCGIARVTITPVH
jgi:hypothetical protein